MVDTKGLVLNFGSAQHLGNWPTTTPPVIVAIEAIPNVVPPSDQQAYWVVNEIGQVYPFGDAQHFGDLSLTPSQTDIVDIVVTADGLGYWLVDQQGKVYNFGNAPFLGDLTSSPPSPGPPAVGGRVELMDGSSRQELSSAQESRSPGELIFVVAMVGGAGATALAGCVWYSTRRRRLGRLD
jgi:hypothetical protein